MYKFQHGVGEKMSDRRTYSVRLRPEIIKKLRFLAVERKIVVSFTGRGDQRLGGKTYGG
jgi:hypothetical protein